MQRTITTPVAAEMFRGSKMVQLDADKTTDFEKQKRAEIATDALRREVANELKKMGEAWEKEVGAEEARRQKLFQFELTKSIAKDEPVVQAMRGMSEALLSRDIAMAQIQGQPGDEVATAQKVLDIKLKAYALDRNQYQTEGEIEEKKRQTRQALVDYDVEVMRHAEDMRRSALAAGGNYQQQLRSLQEQQKALADIVVTSKNASDVALAREALEDKILEVQKQQALAIGTVQQGWRAFFLEMQKKAEDPGRILYQGMTSALDGVSRNLSMLTTGGKTNWGQTFTDIGRQMNESATRAILQKSLGALGEKLGIKKPDGTKQNPIFVSPVDSQGNPLGSVTGGRPSPNALGLGDIFGGYQGRGIFNFAGNRDSASRPPQVVNYNIYDNVVNAPVTGTDKSTDKGSLNQIINTAVAMAAAAILNQKARTVQS
jgi:hypothetical protein